MELVALVFASVLVAGVAIIVVCCRRMYYCTVICLIWFTIHFVVLNVNCQKVIKNNDNYIIHKINHNPHSTKQMNPEPNPNPEPESNPNEPESNPNPNPNPNPNAFLPPHLQHLRNLQGDELKAAIQKEFHEQAIAFIVRQTDYTEEVAAERLGELKDPVKVVQSYLGANVNVEEVKEPEYKSKNQIKYGEIRKLMDAGARQYTAQKELNERRKKYQEHMQQLQEQRKLAQQSHQEQAQQDPQV
jgi:hypothetical protein